ALADLLSPDELERARGFSFEEDSRRFVISRGTLRRVLSGYAEAEPASLRFEYGASGRPELEGRPVRFNLSHCDDLTLIAVTRAADVGVDVERINNDREVERLAQRYFCARERAEIRAKPPRQR